MVSLLWIATLKCRRMGARTDVRRGSQAPPCVRTVLGGAGLVGLAGPAGGAGPEASLPCFLDGAQEAVWLEQALTAALAAGHAVDAGAADAEIPRGDARGGHASRDALNPRGVIRGVGGHGIFHQQQGAL